MSLNKQVSVAGVLIALGIIYGDIGSSPLYVLNDIISGKVITDALVIGSLSLIIWTLTMLHLPQ
ncbi:MAG: KUP/HAK/KT family potassium transporter [Chitinophagaceae bacterium]